MKNTKLIFFVIFASITLTGFGQNPCNLINTVTLNATPNQSSSQTASVMYLNNSSGIISDTAIWHYVALTKNNSLGSFYFDGNLIVSTNFQNNPYIWNSLLLGATQHCVSCSPVVQYSGLIDELRVSNVARTTSQIQSDYSLNLPFSVDTNTIGLFHFDTIYSNIIPNAAGSSATSYGSPYLTTGHFGKALNFDGISDYVNWIQSIPVNNMTVEFWYKSSDKLATIAMLQYAYNTGIYIQTNNATNPLTWSTGATGNSVTVNPSQMPFVWVSNGTCKDTVFFNSQSATLHDTLITHINDTSIVTLHDTLRTHINDTSIVTLHDTLITHINDTTITAISVTDTLLININNTGIAYPNNTNELKVYPNPAKNHIEIDCGNLNAMIGYTIKITNTLGQIVFNNTVTQQSFYVDITSWGGAGTYILYVIDSNQNIKSVKEIVLQ